MEITRWVVEDADGQDFGSWYEDFATADVDARKMRGRVVEYEFEFADSRTVADYTETP